MMCRKIFFLIRLKQIAHTIIWEVKQPVASIDVSGLAAGVYFASISRGNKTAIKKILIER